MKVYVNSTVIMPKVQYRQGEIVDVADDVAVRHIHDGSMRAVKKGDLPGVSTDTEKATAVAKKKRAAAAKKAAALSLKDKGEEDTEPVEGPEILDP